MITVGLDEVGRGCWAGPLVAGAVALPAEIDDELRGLRDSKKLTKKHREVLAVSIQSHALAVGLGWVWPSEIDEHGLTWAVRTAMERAFSDIQISYDQIIIDGNINYLSDNSKATAIIRADNTVPAVSAASIVAKVARDVYMNNLGDAYSGYGFDKHVGYGTPAHIAALKKLGVSDIHRLSYKPIAQILARHFSVQANENQISNRV